MKLSVTLSALGIPLSTALSLSGPDGSSYHLVRESDKRQAPLQDLVTWDKHSMFIRGERAMLFSGEVHPFRLPVPSLYKDVFEKIKALGFNMVSFYLDWALLEGKPGDFSAEGIFAIEPFLEAAQEVGLYLLARPGPYINAEASGGGFPGYLQRIKGTLRTDAPDFLNATDNYMAKVCSIIAKYQITKGGPVVLFQPENEYSHGKWDTQRPNGNYMQYIIDQARKAGIVVPIINNDSNPVGNYPPGSGVGAVEIYGFDAYPVGFSCRGDWEDWPSWGLQYNYHELQMRFSPSTPLSLIEFQGGAFDGWGGDGLENCARLTGPEFARVLYKNNLASGVGIFNVYMIFGGTNWGNLGHPGGFTSYDYGACIRENRAVDREKYSEVKLQGQFVRVSPGYLTATIPYGYSKDYSDNWDIAVTALFLANSTAGGFFVARHETFKSWASTRYKLRLPTSNGTLTIPQLGGATLSLHGRDSKIHVADYPVGKRYSLLYSTAEVFTWKETGDKTVLILYGGPNELHELAVNHNGANATSSENVVSQVEGNHVILQWSTSPERQFVRLGDLTIFLLDRNSAYNYWVPTLPGKDSSPFGTSLVNPKTIIVHGAYLIRSVSIEISRLFIRADFDASTPIEIIGVPPSVTKLSINGQNVDFNISNLGTWQTQVDVTFPSLQVPDLPELEWYQVDSLPEIQSSYDDSPWPNSTIPENYSPLPDYGSRTSLYGSDYGFNTGTLIFRGRFTAKGTENNIYLHTVGGTAFASSVWFNDQFVGSHRGNSHWQEGKQQHSWYGNLDLVAGKEYVITVLVDQMGMDQNGNLGSDDMKARRGIFRYRLANHDNSETPISWKLTGNLGGETYEDRFRGPLNEGGLFFERQGYHYPSPPVDSAVFSRGSPYDGFKGAGVKYYTAKLKLDLPAAAYDVPLSFVIDEGTLAGDYRALLYVNGFQFGKYISQIGPQTDFPVPEGILNYNGDNWIGLAVWAVDASGAKVPGFSLKAGTAVKTSRDKVEVVNAPVYTKRPGAY